MDRLFAEFTGLHFHIAWAPSSSRPWAERILPTGCSVCCRISGSALHSACKTCGPKQLERTLGAAGTGLQFTCRLGVRNYWLPIRVRGETVGIAYLQALNHRSRKRPVRKATKSEAAVVVTAAVFGQAARLLRFVVDYVQTAGLADLRKHELTAAGRAVVALEKEQARLHAALKRHVPVTPNASRRIRPVSHPDEVVQRLLELIERDYAQRITLEHCAGRLGMNAAYLSDLFSRTVGTPFKAHLTSLRMEKAKALLGDGGKNLSEIAGAVGYASENRFRIAFRKATGLSPRAWRETMQLSPGLSASNAGI